MQLSIVIVNYKVPYLLLQCLDAVHKAMQQMDAEVFVVDNHSEDGSQALVEKYFPDVMYIANSTNVGFAKANNQAICSKFKCHPNSIGIDRWHTKNQRP